MARSTSLTPLLWLVSGLFSGLSGACTPSAVCEALSKSPYKDHVFAENTGGYIESLKTYFSSQEADVKPSCIFRPESTEEVSWVVKELSAHFIDANATGAFFAVRSGGHTPWAGSANIQGGVTIDLSHLNKTVLSQDKKQIEIGPGATWGPIYKQLEADKLAIVGGRSAQVGVGGLALGGGLSFLSPRYGFVSDNIDCYEIVVASGEVIKVNALATPDLFKALKGGSNNFGIVTSFTFKTVPLGQIWGGTTYYAFDQKKQHLDNLYAFVDSPNYDVDASLIQTFGSRAGLKAIATNLQYMKPVNDPAPLQPWTKLPHLVTTNRITTLFNLTSEIANENKGGSQGASQRELFWTITIKNDRELLEFGVDTWDTSLNAVKDVKDLTWALVYQPLPKVITSKDKGVDVLGLENAPNLLNVLLSATWNDTSKDSLIYDQANKLFTTINEEAKKKSLDYPFIYLNYAWKSQDVIAGYGQQNKQYLESISKKYDVHGLFQTGLPGGFKLFGNATAAH